MKVESLWRYPVKSMQGERLEEAFIGFPGVYGDRLYAFRSSAAPAAFPYFTGRELQELLLYRPAYRDREAMARPSNLLEAESIGSGLTPVYAGPGELALDVTTPAGAVFAIDDPRLVQVLREGVRAAHELTLMRSDRAMTDCRPVSLISTQTVSQLGRELGAEMDKRRFRANVYLDLESGSGFGEDAFLGLKLQIGEKAVVEVMVRDGRCKMITLDPATGQANPDVMRLVSQSHEGKAGVYAAVLVEGMVRAGDVVRVVD